MRTLLCTLLFLSPAAFAAKEKPVSAPPVSEKPAATEDTAKLDAELAELLENSRVKDAKNFREDLKISRNGEDAPVEKIPPAPVSEP